MFTGNWWDHYRGYDLDRDGVGDVPYPPVRLFALVVEQSEPSLILLRSPFVDLLDAAERVMPVLTPEPPYRPRAQAGGRRRGDRRAARPAPDQGAPRARLPS